MANALNGIMAEPGKSRHGGPHPEESCRLRDAIEATRGLSNSVLIPTRYSMLQGQIHCSRWPVKFRSSWKMLMKFR